MVIARGLLVVASLVSMWQCGSSTDAPGRQSWAAAASLPSGRSVIRGRVTSADGRPVAMAYVWIGPHSTMTGPDGRYEVGRVVQGAYAVQVWKDGFLHWRYQQTAVDDRDIVQVTVGDGVTVESIDVVLPRGAVVTGRVLEPGGMAVPGVHVMTVQRVFQHGRHRLMPYWGSPFPGRVVTNERGEFGLTGVPPGEYYLLAAPPEPAAIPPVAGIRPSALVPTFHPAASRLAAASQFRLDPGAVLSGIDVTLVAADLFEVSGEVVDRSGRSARAGRVQALRRDDLPAAVVALHSVIETEVRPDGGFVLRGLRPGRYGLRALLPTPDAHHVERRIANQREHTASTVVEVGEQDVNGVRLAAARLVTVRGRVTFDDVSAGALTVPRTCVRSRRPGTRTMRGSASGIA